MRDARLNLRASRIMFRQVARRCRGTGVFLVRLVWKYGRILLVASFLSRVNQATDPTPIADWLYFLVAHAMCLVKVVLLVRL